MAKPYTMLSTEPMWQPPTTNGWQSNVWSLEVWSTREIPYCHGCAVNVNSLTDWQSWRHVKAKALLSSWRVATFSWHLTRKLRGRKKTVCCHLKSDTTRILTNNAMWMGAGYLSKIFVNKKHTYLMFFAVFWRPTPMTTPALRTGSLHRHEPTHTAHVSFIATINVFPDLTIWGMALRDYSLSAWTAGTGLPVLHYGEHRFASSQ